MSDYAGLCEGCREMADELATRHLNPDNFKLHVGAWARKKGHKQAHEDITRLYKLTFDQMPIDQYFNNILVA